jgi:hypothetical protein
MELMDHQEEVIDEIASGKILLGGTGWGKSATILGWYTKKYGKHTPKHLFVITTAKKRDSGDWEHEASKFGVGTDPSGEDTLYGILTVDSWNNLHKYTDVEDCVFIFDEQRLVGYGAWTKAFLKIAKKNDWVMLTATPGDTWLDYAPVFIANGYFKNITDFKRKHVLYEPYLRFPKVKGYINERMLEVLRNDMVVEMKYDTHTERYLNYIPVSYDKELAKLVYEKRWHVYENRPILDANEMWRTLRQVVNSDPSRLDHIRWLMTIHPRLIVFYNFDYELEILRALNSEVATYEWNGHKHETIPDDGEWVYLVQYVAGAEGWNCTSTDAMVLYSLTYSYKNFEQVQGRIDRLNTSFTKLYYYVFVSFSIVDRAIKNSLREKKSFNERRFMLEMDKFGEVKWEILENLQI